MNIEETAKELAGNWRRFESFAWHDQPNSPEDYCIVYTHNRDSGLVAQSNADAIAKLLAEFPNDVIEEHHSHWAVGWVDGYAIRVYRRGVITKGFRAYCDILTRLDDYPLLDEEDYSKREYESTIENIKSESYDSDRFAPPEGWEGEVFSWLWDNNQGAVENRDDQGGYPTREEIHEALTALNYGIVWVVRYIDVGQVSEEFDNEESAQERVDELLANNIYATYESVLPELVG